MQDVVQSLQAAGRQPQSVVTGYITHSTGGPVNATVDGVPHLEIPNPSGVTYAAGQSVAFLRLGHGRYQAIGLAGHWAPPA